MMKFYKKLYVGESIKNPVKVRWKLAHGAGQLKIYVIALAGGDDLLEIYHCAYLQQKYYKKYPPFIVGIAGSYDEAVSLTQTIIEEVYADTGDFAVKEYILNI
ncbi:MAG: hypothetical protein IJ485_06775 [Lachnospiraceae bacterium]|nr:hypothetical protein [Lachnospiraceae bacterium]